MSKLLEKNLWDIAIEAANQEEEDGKASEEASIFFIGSKNAGKTSIILRFLDRDEPPKPTTALEYTFGRRAKGHNIAKDVGHIWELGGGTWLSKLIDIPINPDSIINVSLIIVLDLSKPTELWFTLEKLLSAAKSRIENAILEAKSEDPHIKEKLAKKAWERIGEEHTDRDMLDPFLIPVAIIGSKYDLFQDFDSEKRKVIAKTLRFVSHTHGAILQFFSTKQEALMTKTRQLISHMVFGTAPSKAVQLDQNKPLLVPNGQDSLEQIGNPPLSDGDIGRITARTPMDLWKQAFTSYFPQEHALIPTAADDPAKDPQYTEPAIDAMRSQKDEELERYRRICERRAKEASQRAMAEGYA